MQLNTWKVQTWLEERNPLMFLTIASGTAEVSLKLVHLPLSQSDFKQVQSSWIVPKSTEEREPHLLFLVSSRGLGNLLGTTIRKTQAFLTKEIFTIPYFSFWEQTWQTVPLVRDSGWLKSEVTFNWRNVKNKKKKPTQPLLLLSPTLGSLSQAAHSSFQAYLGQKFK